MDKEYQNQREFIRLPKSGTRCPVSGLSRSALNELVLPSEKNHFRPPVRSHSLRKPGQIKGVRLIDVKALKEFIRGLPV